MTKKLILFSRLAVLGVVALSLPVYAQYSTPMRDVSDPGRTPFQVFNVTVIAAADNTPIVIASVPAGTQQRLVVDFAQIAAQGSSTIPVKMSIHIGGSATVPDFQITFPLTPLPIPVGSQAISTNMQNLRFYVSAGQTLSVMTLNQGAQALFVTTAFTGHYVSLP